MSTEVSYTITLICISKSVSDSNTRQYSLNAFKFCFTILPKHLVWLTCVINNLWCQKQSNKTLNIRARPIFYFRIFHCLFHQFWFSSFSKSPALYRKCFLELLFYVNNELIHCNNIYQTLVDIFILVFALQATMHRGQY